jgi:hypothetical protein
MKKTLTLLFFLTINLVIFSQLNQQQVVASAGGISQNGQTSIEWTLGEAVIYTLPGNNVKLTQGFHQTNLIPTVIKELVELDFEIMAYPNPVMESVTLKVEKPQGLYYILYDLNGQILEQKKIKNIETEIEFKNLPPSDYIIRIISNDYEMKSFKIVKN